MSPLDFAVDALPNSTWVRIHQKEIKDQPVPERDGRLYRRDGQRAMSGRGLIGLPDDAGFRTTPPSSSKKTVCHCCAMCWLSARASRWSRWEFRPRDTTGIVFGLARRRRRRSKALKTKRSRCSADGVVTPSLATFARNRGQSWRSQGR